MNKTISIAGKDYVLDNIDGQTLRQVWVEARAAFRFYSCNFKGTELLVLEPKSSQKHTPRKLRLISERLHSIMGKNVVFLFEQLPYVERNRLIDQDVFFVVSGKYAFLPSLLIAARETEPVRGEKLTAAAQWLLLAYLQGVDINHKTAKETELASPYKYVTLTRAFRLLEGLELCTIETGDDKYKRISFDSDKKALFEKSMKYLVHPVKQRWYSDEIKNIEQYKLAGISALSHYSALNPDGTTTIALTAEQWKHRNVDDFLNVNPIEGDCCIEIWQYPPIPTDKRYVDKLSLALSLQNDHDPRVEKEVELMIEKLW